MEVIKVDKLTKDYGNHRGCFDVSFFVGEGEVFGFLGPNGAGKTTTIRQLLGFIKADKGAAYINGKNVWDNAHTINGQVGYLPGEINFPQNMTGMDLIKWMADMRGTKNLDKARELLNMFELNPNSDVKRMSKGMKQKVGIVCAFMHDSPIYILDEPTSGLDPLMQQTFVELIEKEKRSGKTILMSSHMFPEVEKTCNRLAIIRQGEIVTQVNMNDIKKAKIKTFKVKFLQHDGSRLYVKENPKMDFVEVNHEKNRVKVKVNDDSVNNFIAALSKYSIKYVSEIKLTLEDYFMQFYSSMQKEAKNAV